ncbi:MAG: DUF3048 domain-containing protein [Clostridium sp.]|nr:DUF3048 domain-containing protein [Clostridium sp.]MCM1444361.1 DUF3048 domain-containing protein [Candidatus Amulumruptor caecigallinarius]
MKKSCKILSCILLLFSFFFTGCFNKNEEKVEEVKEPEKEIKTLNIVDLSSNSRPYAVMINNHASARPYHSGLQDAYIVYEMIVEGGITRYMAIFKDKDTSKIGSVRSSRHYYLDYAMENDAMYVHWGWSPQAQSDIKTLGINNINGLTYEGTYFFRDKTLNVAYEHKGYTSMELLKKAADRLKYRTTTTKDLLLNYSIDDISLQNMEGSKIANKVSIKYSSAVTTSYVYDDTTKLYKRYVNNKEHKDYVTKEQYTVKNIITYQVKNSNISGDSKGRQNFDNIGSGTGYYITNGYAVPIKWEKSSRDSQTVYKYLDGTEITVNDGNTYIQIQPLSQNLEISE